VWRHDTINVDHLHFLVGGSRDTLGRLCSNMALDGYIDPPDVQTRTWRSGGRKPTAYRLGDKGARRLKEMGHDVTAFETSYWRKKNSELGDVSFFHKLLITSMNIGVARAVAEIGGRYEYERENDQLRDQVYIDIRGKKMKWSVAPDTFSHLTWPNPSDTSQEFTRHFLKEADRGTMPLIRNDFVGSSMHKKYAAILEWAFRKRGHRQLGINGFTVLTVTSSAERAENLRSLISQTVDPKGKGTHLFWVAPFPGDKEWRQFLEPIWLSAGDPPGSDVRHSLTEVG
jgi:hypothetical protein